MISEGNASTSPPAIPHGKRGTNNMSSHENKFVYDADDLSEINEQKNDNDG